MNNYCMFYPVIRILFSISANRNLRLRPTFQCSNNCVKLLRHIFNKFRYVLLRIIWDEYLSFYLVTFVASWQRLQWWLHCSVSDTRDHGCNSFSMFPKLEWAILRGEYMRNSGSRNRADIYGFFKGWKLMLGV